MSDGSNWTNEAIGTDGRNREDKDNISNSDNKDSGNSGDIHNLTAWEIEALLSAGESRSFDSHSPEDTFLLGRKLGEASRAGLVVALTGDLGTGKTVFTQGFARGLGIPGPVNSPTFTIMQVYEEGRLPLYHFDVYRIGDIEEMEEIGYEDCFYSQGVCLVEWADQVREILPGQCLHITLTKVPEKGFDYRCITLQAW